MGVKTLVVVIIGIVGFVVVNLFITAVIIGTDTGSAILQNVLRIIIAAAIVLGVLMSLERG